MSNSSRSVGHTQPTLMLSGPDQFNLIFIALNCSLSVSVKMFNYT